MHEHPLKLFHESVFDLVQMYICAGYLTARMLANRPIQVCELPYTESPVCRAPVPVPVQCKSKSTGRSPSMQLASPGSAAVSGSGEVGFLNCTTDIITITINLSFISLLKGLLSQGLLSRFGASHVSVHSCGLHVLPLHSVRFRQ